MNSRMAYEEEEAMPTYIGAGAGDPRDPHIKNCKNCKSTLKKGLTYFYRWCSKTCYIKYYEDEKSLEKK